MTTDTAPPPPPPPAASPPGPTKRLTRRPEGGGRHVAGVAGGLADHFAVDANLVRLGFAVLALFGGGGFALYAVLWLVLPERGAEEAVAQRLLRKGQDRAGGERGPGFWVGSALITIAALTILDTFVDGTLAWSLVLIVVGVVLFQADRGEGPLAAVVGPATTAPGSPSTSATTSVDDRDEVTDEVWDDVPGAPTPPAPPLAPHGAAPVTPAPTPPRERSVLGRLTLGVVVLWVGGALLWNAAVTTPYVTWAGIVGIAMAIVGGGLLVGSRRGRARWLWLVGALLVPCLGMANLVDRVDVDRGAGMGQLHLDVTPGTTTVDETWFAGELLLHLDDLEPSHPDVSVTGRLGVGLLDVRVPPGWGITLRARADGGLVDFHSPWAWQPDRSGLGLDVDRTLIEPLPGHPTAHLDLEVDWGEIRIRQGYDPDYEALYQAQEDAR